MPLTAPKRKKNTQQNHHNGVSLHLPRELVHTLGELLQELAFSKRKEREDKDKKPVSRWEKFWTWWKDYGVSAVAIVTVISALIGGLWTLNLYIAQEREKTLQQEYQTNLERQALIAQFASELSDKSKRNASAYAFALLAGEEAVPLLISELVTTAKYDPDQTYQDALARSLIQIGNPALEPVFAVNKEYRKMSGEENARVVVATQPIIYSWLMHKPEYFVNQNNLFIGVGVEDLFLDNVDLSGFDLSGINIKNSMLCTARFYGVTIKSASITSSELGGAGFLNAAIHGIEIDKNSKAVGIHFTESEIISSRFYSDSMQSSHWDRTKIFDSHFDFANLQSASFTDAEITGSSFYDTALYNARFTNTLLKNVTFVGADLENTDLSGARFDIGDNINVFGTPDDVPRLLRSATSGNYEIGGAFVRNADFANVSGLNEESLIYLCRWGAINVPGGCDGIQVNDMSKVPTTRPSMFDWCY